MDEATFHEKADIILQEMTDAIEVADDSGEIEVDFLDGVLNVILPNEDEYVINKHEPTRQIWVSSPQSGSTKFSYDDDEGEWMPSQGRNLRDFISIEFSKYYNMNVEF